MRYYKQEGKYQKLYVELYQELVPEKGEKSVTMMGEFLRLLSNLYHDVIEQPSNVWILPSDFEFLKNSQYFFNMLSKDEEYNYFMSILFEQYWSTQNHMPTSFEVRFTYVIDDLIDTILELYQFTQPLDNHK